MGDDAAVLAPPVDPMLLCADTAVEGVHWDPTLSSDADAGWKALAATVSDIAAMGGRPGHALVTITVPDGAGERLYGLFDGLQSAADRFGCPIVGGDLSAGPVLVVTTAATGSVAGSPVLRTGAQPDDRLFVTGPLGLAASGLRRLRSGERAGPAVDAHRRPMPRLAEGEAARAAGATAMLDLSDGIGIDVRRLAAASAVGIAFDGLPVGDGATLEEAVGGGDDYELLFAAPDPGAVMDRFVADGLRRPVEVGRCTDDPTECTLAGRALPAAGWEHRW